MTEYILPPDVEERFWERLGNPVSTNSSSQFRHELMGRLPQAFLEFLAEELARQREQLRRGIDEEEILG